VRHLPHPEPRLNNLSIAILSQEMPVSAQLLKLAFPIHVQKYNCLFKGTKRFVELKRLMPDITSRMLTLQLRELEADQIVSRKVFAEVPSRVEYSLTIFGKALEPAFTKIGEWGRAYTRKLKNLE
jgi:DNA-binding HxlR family transcriptional regulator